MGYVVDASKLISGLTRQVVKYLSFRCLVDFLVIQLVNYFNSSLLVNLWLIQVLCYPVD
jgi:hypothetical protein